MNDFRLLIKEDSMAEKSSETFAGSDRALWRTREERNGARRGAGHRRAVRPIS